MPKPTIQLELTPDDALLIIAAWTSAMCLTVAPDKEEAAKALDCFQAVADYRPLTEVLKMHKRIEDLMAIAKAAHNA